MITIVQIVTATEVTIQTLARLFADYKVYPEKCYGPHSPVGVFRKMFSRDHYSRDLEELLRLQQYAPEQRGADLPWWGKKYFTQEKGFRTLVIAQDSLTPDAGSIVLYAHLMPIVQTKEDFLRYEKQINAKGSFYNSWKTVKEQLQQWDIDFDFLYMTDAKKVYKKQSWKDWDFDSERSKALLHAEVDVCNPDLIILLGASPLRSLDPKTRFAPAVDGGKCVIIQGRQCAVSPFFIGQGRTQGSFKKRLGIVTNLIRKTKATRAE